MVSNPFVVVIVLFVTIRCLSVGVYFNELLSASPDFVADATNILETVNDLTGSPVNVVFLPENDAAAAASLAGITDLGFVIFLADPATHPMLDAAIMASGVPSFADHAIVPEFRPMRWYGGPSLLDQTVAFIRTRPMLPNLDIADMVVVVDGETYPGLAENIERIALQVGRKSVTSVVTAAGASKEDVLEAVFDLEPINYTAFALFFPPSRFGHAEHIIRALYGPTNSVTFLVADHMAEDLCESLSNDPLEPSEAFSVSFEAFSSVPVSHPNLTARLNSTEITRSLAFIHSVASITTLAIAQLRFHGFMTYEEFGAVIDTTSTLPATSVDELIIGPTACPEHDIFRSIRCFPCNQLSRTLHRVTVQTDGGHETPEYVPKHSVETVCGADVAGTGGSNGLVMFTAMFAWPLTTEEWSFLKGQPTSLINRARQIGAYSGLTSVNDANGLNGRPIIPQTFWNYVYNDTDSLVETINAAGGGFVINMQFSSPEAVRGIQADIIAVRELGIELMMWGTNTWLNEITLINGTNRRDPALMHAMVRFVDIVTAACRFAQLRGHRTVIAYVVYFLDREWIRNDAAAHVVNRCAAFGVDNIVLTRRRNATTPETMSGQLVETSAAILDSLGMDNNDEFLLFYDPYTTELCTALTEAALYSFPSADLLFWSAETSNLNVTHVPNWKGRTFGLFRWPHYSLPTPLSAAFLRDVDNYDADVDVFIEDKWIHTRLMAAVMQMAAEISDTVDYQSFSYILHNTHSFFIDGFTFGPYSRQPGDETVLEGDVCNSMVKQLFVYALGNATQPIFIPTAEVGSDPLLDWWPYCEFFIPTPVVVGTSLIALWITLGCVGIVLMVSCCCCFLFCWLILLLGLLLTRQRKSAHTYRVLKDKAEEASRLKSLFVSNMSHELRTPLNAIIGTIDLVKDTTMSNEQQRSMDVVESSSELLLDIVNDVLLAAQLAAGQIDNDPTEICLPSVFEAVMRAAANSTNKAIAYYTYYLPGTPFTVKVDRRRLSQILMNIVGNATKFTLEGSVRVVIGPRQSFEQCYNDVITGNISVDCQVTDSDELVVEVDDSGIGLPETEYENVFNRFTRFSSEQANHGGTGLGLNIAKQLVETALHGTITAGRSPDLGGARFTFTGTLPVVDVPPPLAESLIGHIVLIDDIPGMPHGRSVASVLRVLGLSPDSVSLATLGALANVRPTHVIVCNIVANAGSCLAAVREAYGGARVIMTSNKPVSTAGVTVLAVPVSCCDIVRALTGNTPPIATTPPDTRPCVIDTGPVVVAEDDVINCRMLDTFFKRINIVPQLYSNAIDLIASLDPDDPPTLAVLDFHMPGMTGEECAIELRQRYGQNITIVLMTADITVDGSGTFDHVLYKPVRFQSFKETITALGQTQTHS